MIPRFRLIGNCKHRVHVKAASTQAFFWAGGQKIQLIDKCATFHVNTSPFHAELTEEVLSALILQKMLLAAAVVAMFSKHLKAKSLEMSVTTPMWEGQGATSVLVPLCQ